MKTVVHGLIDKAIMQRVAQVTNGPTSPAGSEGGGSPGATRTEGTDNGPW